MVGGSPPTPAGVAAAYARPLDATGQATLAAATYAPPDPVIPPNPVLPVGSVSLFDLLLLGDVAGDLVQATFYPPDPVIPPNPITPPDPVFPPEPLRLAWWGGAAWLPVFIDSTANPRTYPTYDSLNNRFSVSFTDISSPQVTQLTGTVFAVVASFGLVGFEPPVDNGVLNIAKAGRVVPLRWSLYDLGGNPVTNLTAAQITSVPLSCAAVNGVADAVENYATGASGLQNLGGGAYQINWATPKSFAGSCRRLRLDLGEKRPNGTPFYRTADFDFAK